MGQREHRQPVRAKGAPDASGGPLSLSPSLSSSQVNNTTQHNNEGVGCVVSVHLTRRQVAYLDSKGKGRRSAFVRQALDNLMALDATEAEQVRLEARALESEIEQKRARLRLLKARLEDFDEDLVRETAWREDYQLYIHTIARKGEPVPSAEAQEHWARGRGVPAEVFARIRAEVTHG